MKKSAHELINNFLDLNEGLKSLNMTIEEFVRACLDSAHISKLDPEDFVKILLLTTDYDIGEKMISLCKDIVVDNGEKNGKRALALVFLMAKRHVGEEIADKLDEVTRATLSLPWVHAMCEMVCHGETKFREQAYAAISSLIFATKDRKALEAFARVIEVCRQSVGVHHTGFYTDLMKTYSSTFPPNPDIFVTILGTPMYSVLLLQYGSDAKSMFLTTIKNIFKTVLFPSGTLTEEQNRTMLYLMENYEGMVEGMSQIAQFLDISTKDVTDITNRIKDGDITFVTKSDDDLKKNIQ
jgi:hypothetical protein